MNLTGLFGPKTFEFVKQFQAAQGLPATGGVDAATKQALYRVPDINVDWDLRTECVDLAYGAEGNCPRSLQYLLMQLGEPLRGTGKYQDITRAAVKNFQAGVGLDVNGIVDTQTKRALYSRLVHSQVETPPIQGITYNCELTTCKVFLGKNSTRSLDRALQRFGPVTDVVAQLLTKAACKLIPNRVIRALCEWGSNLATDAAIQLVHSAANDGACLGVHLLAPLGFNSWIPIRVVSTNDPTYCPA